MIAALARGSSAIGVDLKPEYSGYTIGENPPESRALGNWA